ncbi:MAG: ribosomal protein L11 methyltransferase [Planctomycetota bacterium]|jgi:ribosomal protein L11 methyltransferase
MPWWQFSISCETSELEQVEDLLFELGAASISLADAGDEPLYEPLPGHSPVWQESIITGMFNDANHETIYHRLLAELPQHLLSSLRQQRLEEQDWEQAYKAHFKPIRFGDRLWIVPDWCEPPDTDAAVVTLDPGLAFGTGSHPTTALCLEWLGNNDISDCDAIDYGCGSGILAIAACKLGARRVLAVDIDPQALTASKLNAGNNSISDEQIEISLPEAMSHEPVALLMANILSGPLVRFAPKFADLVKPGGQILLSGILASQLNDIQSAYQPYFILDQANQQQDWIAISGTRKGNC